MTMDEAFEAYRKVKFGAYGPYPVDAYTYFCAGWKAAITAAKGWKHYLDEPPPSRTEKIEIWRPEWAAPTTTTVELIPAVMNVNGLYWRPFAAAQS